MSCYIPCYIMLHLLCFLIICCYYATLLQIELLNLSDYNVMLTYCVYILYIYVMFKMISSSVVLICKFQYAMHVFMFCKLVIIFECYVAVCLCHATCCVTLSALLFIRWCKFVCLLQGCKQKLSDWLQENAVTIVGMDVSLMLIQVINCLRLSLSPKKKRRHHDLHWLSRLSPGVPDGRDGLPVPSVWQKSCFEKSRSSGRAGPRPPGPHPWRWRGLWRTELWLQPYWWWLHWPRPPSTVPLLKPGVLFQKQFLSLVEVFFTPDSDHLCASDQSFHSSLLGLCTLTCSYRVNALIN